jgi:hypothetical protein
MLRRRKRRLLALTASLVEVARTGYNEAREIELVRQPIYLENLPAPFDGYTIAQISDIHHGSFVEADHVGRAVYLINRLQPNLIVLTGDYVTHSRAYIEPCGELLGELRATDGVFAVLGNHDFWTDADQMARALKRRGVGVLRNTHTLFERHGDRLALVGVDDSTVRRHDLGAALGGLRAPVPKILLSHNPNLIRQAAEAKVDLMLSGHTHGGQINLPAINKRSRRRWTFWRGYGQLEQTQIYVNRGLGTVVVPVRYQCPPEITLIELKRRPSDQRPWWSMEGADDHVTIADAR